MTFVRLRAGYEKFLETIVILLMVVLFCEVTVGVVFRMSGASLSWYDEIASVLLAWLTYYGAALAAIKRAHIGCPAPIAALKPTLRVPLTLLGEAFVFGFLIVLAWMGYAVMDVLATDYLVSLPEVSVAYTQSVIPIGAILFIIAEALSLPEILRQARELKPAGGNVYLESSH
jgi:TRAP-type C4-dicarboxylate transport system permease small subunit